ncbi:type VI secretion system protein TssA [candidate division KSB1 bacterium]|nr:type VI secretion system protein TssA [candidate division KSB1 bacterium]
MPESEEQQVSAPTVEAPAAEQPKPLSPLLEAIKRPIPGDNPCGRDVASDDAFQKIKEEINRIGAVSTKVDYGAAAEAAQDVKSLTSAKLREMAKKGETLDTKSFISDTSGVDYPMIVELAAKILSEKSKDLRVAGYLCFALWRSRRFSGLAEGLMAIHILLQEFWEGLFPAKSRLAARKAAIEFLTQKLPEALEAAEVQVDDREPLESAKQTLTELQKEVTAKIPQSDFLLMGTIQAVGKCLAKVPVKQEPQPSPQPGLQPVAAPQPEPGPQPGSAPARGPMRTSDDAVTAIREAAKFLRGQDRKSAAPYRLARSMRWDVLVNEPPNENGKTKVEAPRAQRREYFTKLQQSGQWDKLLDDGETDFMQPYFYYWLDLQRFIVAAMDALGSDFQHARMAILQELAILLQRVPQLPSLIFSDGTRFADAVTQSWIEETVMPALGSGENAGVGPAGPALDSDLAALFAEAKKILAKGDLAAAIAYLQDGATLDVSGKNRFCRRLHIATVCLRGGQPKMARPLLEDLSEEIEKFAITVWEPALALEVWKNLYECYGSLTASTPPAGKAGLQEHADRVFEKMCRLDLSYALAASGTKPKTKRPAPPKPTKRTAAEMDEHELITVDEMDSREPVTADEKDERGESTDGKVKRGKKAAVNLEEKGKRETTPAATG